MTFLSDLRNCIVILDILELREDTDLSFFIFLATCPVLMPLSLMFCLVLEMQILNQTLIASKNQQYFSLFVQISCAAFI